MLGSCTAKDCMTECLELTAVREMAYNLALCSCMGGKDITGKAMQIETQYLEMSSIVRYMSCSRYFTGNVCVCSVHVKYLYGKHGLIYLANLAAKAA